VVRAWDSGSVPVALWAKLLNVLSTSTLIRRHRTLLLLILSRLLPSPQPGGRFMCGLDVQCESIPDSLVPGTVIYYPKPRIFGNRLVGVTLSGHRSVCLGLPCKVCNQSMLASHHYLSLLIPLSMISLNDGTM
jgi:hypothetical protein